MGPGLALGICYTVVTPYFDKKKGRANALMVSGSSAAQMIVTPLFRYLLDEYSFRGAALVYTGVLMNAYIGVSFFHPLKYHLKPCEEDQEETQEKWMPPEDDSPDSHHLSSNNTDAERVKPMPLDDRDGCVGPRVSVASVDFPVGLVSVPSVASSLDVKESDNVNVQTTCGFVRRLGNTFVRVGRNILMNFKLFGSFRVCLISFSYTLGCGSFYGFLMLAPFAMLASGHSLQDSAWCLSAMGATNLITRFAVSSLSDWEKFDHRLCMIVGSLVKAVSAVGESHS